MMKKFFRLMLLAALLAAGGATAGERPACDTVRRSVAERLLKKPMPRALNIDLHMRTSLHGQFPNGQTGRDQTAFRFDYIALDLHGEITPKLTYKYLQRLNKGSRVGQTDNLSAGIDYAWVKYRFDRRFAVQAGRHALFFGGFEYEEYPVDVYDYAGIINNISCYLNGVSFFYSPAGGQELGLQVVNNRQGSVTEAFGEVPDGLEPPSMPLYYSFCWNASFAGDRLRLRHALTVGEPLRDKWAFLFSGGVQWQGRRASAYFDWAYQRSEIDHLGVVRRMVTDAQGAVWEGVGRNVAYLTFTANLSCRFLPKWNLRLKAFHDRGSVYAPSEHFAEGDYLSAWGGNAGVEFFPMGDGNMHLYVNVGGRIHRRNAMPGGITPRDALRCSLGLVYRLPVL